MITCQIKNICFGRSRRIYRSSFIYVCYACLTYLQPMDLCVLAIWTRTFVIEGMSILFYFFLVFNANNVKLDQMVLSALSDLDLHCLPRQGDARY